MTDAARPSKPLHCVLIRNCDVMDPPQGASYIPAISDATVGSTGLWFGLVRIAPDHRTKAHTHPHETGIYIVKGSIELFSGWRLEETVTAAERDFVLIPEGVPHVAVNRSDGGPVFAVVARSNPAHEEPATLEPSLDELVP
jgi:uncharacterized RmlC-like cupin family protein